ncbi:hypothetical protein KKP04_02680 [Rhodomicrobium sp. Az07]|uniref:hypothetical protein n=1 Tax=Rhodomicrobium sp. Az07 TaxID=2839034 RepID=UPI001BE66039|nr:hypothetical protein [Rhodomicrobium sp. Az07]MBT3069772.1 hypothetical protein [Rhodomicrobium sp. Az07]
MLEVPTTPKRVVVIQYRWCIQSYTRDLIYYLSDHGYLVTLFIDKASLEHGVINSEKLRNSNVDIIELCDQSSQNVTLWDRLKSRAKREVLARLSNPLSLLDGSDFEFVSLWMQTHRDETIAIIGIEKLGLIFAGAIADKYSVPYIYYSLELYFRELSDASIFQQQVAFECMYHKGAIATLIQDEFRGEALFKHNIVSSQPKIFIPIGVPTLPKAESSSYWHRKFDLPEDSRIFLYFGTLALRPRCLDALIDAWAGCPAAYVLVLHGVGDPAEIREFCEQRRLRNVFVSADVVPEEQIRELVASADVGICIYKNTTVNERLTAFSSHIEL